MRIIIDMQGSQTESRFRGIGRHTLSLAQAMARNAGDHEVWVAINGAFRDGIGDIHAALDGLLSEQRILQFNTFREVGWPNAENGWRRNASELMWEAFLDDVQPDFLHIFSLFEGSQGGAVTSVGKLAGVQTATSATLHDLIPLLAPEVYLTSDWARAWYMDKVEALKRADLLLSVSQYAREEALQALDIDPARVVNMSSAISPYFRPLPIGEVERAMLRERFGIQGRYVMCSGPMESRKNAEGPLKAFAMLTDALRRNTQFVFAGKASDHDRIKFNDLASALGIANRVIFTGYVSDEELIALYSAATVYVFPSLHEGFGLPALEAMACGAPTIGSNTTSVPEVIGRQDALFDPRDPAAIARSISRVLEDETFAAELRAYAPRRAACFSWDSTARTALTAMESVVAHRPSRRRIWPIAGETLQATYSRLIEAIGGLEVGVKPSEHDQLEAAMLIGRSMATNDALARAGELPVSLCWRVEGPFDSNYSLALVNRCLADALARRGHQVGLHSTEGPGDFEPSADFLAGNPRVAELHRAAAAITPSQADVTSRLLYPPRVTDVASRINLLHAYPWEESALPPSWVENFNDALQGISCVSEHVRKIMVDNGVATLLGVCWNGVDHWDEVVADPNYPVPGKGFRFLHVSSCFPRKGVDVMLKAYGKAFTRDDDVSLIIKTFANPHNEVHRWLDDARRHNPVYPDVHIIEDDISNAELKHLYASCHALLAPSRAEGFGLPLAEAMLMELPVVTTAWGGQLDFCNEQTAWLVDYCFARAQTHFHLSDSVWAEPDPDALTEAMRQVRDAAPALIKARTTAAKHLLRSRFKWSDAVQRLEQDVRRFAAAPTLPEARIGWITSWNTRCGVATYASNLMASTDPPAAILAGETDDRTFQDGPEVVRCWHKGEGDMLERLVEVIERLHLNTLIVQFQYAFFDFRALAAFLRQQKAAGRVVIVMMHATEDPVDAPNKQLRFIASSLAECDRVLVHSLSDLNRLKQLGVKRNTAIFPHGIIESSIEALPADLTTRFHIASYGFFLPHKGLLELIDAVALLVRQGMDVELSMINAEYPEPVSHKQIDLAVKRIAQHSLQSRVRMVTQFLRDQESMSELAKADVVVFPYQCTGESASGAVRYGLASGKPVAVTPLAIFDDVSHVVHRLPGTGPQDIANGLRNLFHALHNDVAFGQVQQRAAQWCVGHRYPALARRLQTMSRQLLQQRREECSENNLAVKCHRDEINDRQTSLHNFFIVDPIGDLELMENISNVKAATEFQFKVRVRNKSKTEWWTNDGTNPVNVSYHWYDQSGNIVIHDGERTPLRPAMECSCLASGDTCEQVISVISPPHAGKYSLRVTLVQEGVQWFFEPAFNPARLDVLVN
jgi:glycosyltransferase involved in cell wall biosynthesis